MDYEVIVIGGGPGGYVAAIKAAQLGKRTCIIEKERFGGTCLNVGCIPTKALLKSAEVLNSARKAADFGVKGIRPEQLSLDLNLAQERKRRVVDALVSGVRGLLKKNGVTVISAAGSFLDSHTIRAGEEKITGEAVIIATGSTVKMLPIEIDEAMPLYTSAEVLSMRKAPGEMAIIGGGVIGVELAYFLLNIGVKVKIIEFLPRILPMVDGEITQMVEKQLRDMGAVIHTGAKVLKVEKDRVCFEKDEKQQEEAAEGVLMAVGRTPNLQGLNLEAAGVKTERGVVLTDERLRTNVEGIFAVGDVNGKSMLAHTASMEGVIAAEVICGQDVKMSYDKIPSAIYIKPEIACVGLTEEQAKETYGDIKVGRFPMMANGKSKIEGDEQGLIKIITEKRYGEIVGAHLYCVHATDMIAEMSLAMGLECTAEELVAAVHPHPTISEAVHEACHAAVFKAIHI